MKFGQKLESLLEYLLALLLAIMVMLLLGQVITRFILSGSMLWATEMAVWLFVWVTFLGSALLLRRKDHMVVNILEMIIPEDLYLKFQKYLNIFVDLTIYIFLGVIFYNSIPVVQSVSNQYATSVPISKVYLFSSLPVSIILMFIFLSISIYEEIKEG